MKVNNPKKIKICPLCGKNEIVLLKERKVITKSNGEVLNGYWWFYECGNCKERFTTTESDEISLNKLL